MNFNLNLSRRVSFQLLPQSFELRFIIAEQRVAERMPRFAVPDERGEEARRQFL